MGGDGRGAGVTRGGRGVAAGAAGLTTGALSARHDRADWVWGEVAARADVAAAGAVCLTHLRSGAQLLVRGGRCARGAGYAGAPAADRHALARAGAVLRLRARGRYLIHAAAAVDPRTGKAWLFAGDSGCGKSTLVYALARAGWTPLADDGLPVEPVAGGGAVAHPWRSPLLVSDAQAPHFPELRGRAPLLPDDARRRVAAAPPVGAGAARPASAPVAAIVFPAQTGRDAADRLGATAALAAIVRQSPWALLGDADAPRHLAALRDLAAAVPAFRLEHTARQLRRIARTLDTLPV